MDSIERGKTVAARNIFPSILRFGTSVDHRKRLVRTVDHLFRFERCSLRANMGYLQRPDVVQRQTPESTGLHVVPVSFHRELITER